MNNFRENTPDSNGPKRIEEIETVLDEIDALYPSRKSIVRALAGYSDQMEYKSHDSCPSCTSVEIVYSNNDRFLKCKFCGFEEWLTSGTFFRSVKKPKAWITAIHLFERGIIVNAPELHRIAMVSVSTASNIILKIGMIFENLVEETYPSVLSGEFTEAIGKRSSLTPVGERPRDELKTTEECLSHEGDGACYSPTSESNTLPKDTPFKFENLSQFFDSEDEFGGFVKSAEILLRELSNEPLNLDFLCEKTGFKVAQAVSILTVLELAGC